MPTTPARSARDYALEYIRRGFTVEVYHKAPGKRGPRERRRPYSTDAQVRALPITAWTKSTCVAMRIDEKHAYVDLDADVALKLAAYFLPPTGMISGRPGRPASHWWYELSAPDADRRGTKFQDPSAAAGQRVTLLEYYHASPAAGDAEHAPIAISPPSPYDDDYIQRAYWDRFDEIGVAPAEHIYRRCELLAAACMLVRCWTEGQRNTLTLALSAVLLRSRWTPEQVRAFLSPIAETAGDSDVQNRLSQQDATDEKVQAGEPTYGWPTISDTVGTARTTKLMRWLVRRTASSGKRGGSDPVATASQLKTASAGDTFRHVPEMESWAAFRDTRWVLGYEALLDLRYTTILMLEEERKRTARAAPIKMGDIEEAISALACDPAMRANVDDFDTHAALLNLPNGTYDLDKEVMREHDPLDLITRVCPTLYGPRAECPTWRRQISLTWEDPEIAAYIQRAVGYSLQATQSERCFFLLHGRGRNGKSIFLRVLEYVLGTGRLGYAQQVSPASFGRAQIGEIHSGLAQLRGIRLASVGEFPNRSLAADLIKSITGGEGNTSREIRERVSRFPFQCKLWFTSNFKPGPADTTDDAFWERMHAIPCNHQFPAPGMDDWVAEPVLLEALQEEASGILNWALEGHAEWRRIGLALPAALQQTRREYQDELDLLGQYILSDLIEVDPALVAATASSGSGDESITIGGVSISGPSGRHSVLNRDTLHHVWLSFDTWATEMGYPRQYRGQCRTSNELRRALEMKGFVVDNPYKRPNGSGGQNIVSGLRVVRDFPES